MLLSDVTRPEFSDCNFEDSARILLEKSGVVAPELIWPINTSKKTNELKTKESKVQNVKT